MCGQSHLPGPLQTKRHERDTQEMSVRLLALLGAVSFRFLSGNCCSAITCSRGLQWAKFVVTPHQLPPFLLSQKFQLLRLANKFSFEPWPISAWGPVVVENTLVTTIVMVMWTASRQGLVR